MLGTFACTQHATHEQFCVKKRHRSTVCAHDTHMHDTSWQTGSSARVVPRTFGEALQVLVLEHRKYERTIFIQHLWERGVINKTISQGRMRLRGGGQTFCTRSVVMGLPW